MTGAHCLQVHRDQCNPNSIEKITGIDIVAAQIHIAASATPSTRSYLSGSSEAWIHNPKLYHN